MDSLLKIPLVLPLVRRSEPVDMELSGSIVGYVKGAYACETAISEEVSKLAQGYYITQRDRNECTPSDLHLLLTMTRYVAKSYTRSVANPEDWRRAVEVFQLIKER